MQDDTKLDMPQDGFAKETMLELIESEDGRLLLRDMDGKEDPLVSIDFSDKIKDMLGEDAHMIGQHMIHAAIQVIMNKQMNHWHAKVYDEEPTNYS
ncbi:hypothetical protein VH441_03930 [Psychrobacter sp. HD31]|uniref:hypothetical protein n=1 Tax=Psychrobacter sp. HD31 TaxID=3112003 RepID=UPI003DA5A4E6